MFFLFSFNFSIIRKVYFLQKQFCFSRALTSTQSDATTDSGAAHSLSASDSWALLANVPTSTTRMLLSPSSRPFKNSFNACDSFAVFSYWYYWVRHVLRSRILVLWYFYLSELSKIVLFEIAKSSTIVVYCLFSKNFRQIQHYSHTSRAEYWMLTMFECINLLVVKLIMSGHDVSDGGLLCAALEMAIAGHVSLKMDFWLDDEYESVLSQLI